jgi:hypothetical protein
MANIRLLRQDEIDEAKRVFQNSIEYQKVYIQEHDGGVMTWNFQDRRLNWYYVIYWDSDVYKNGAISRNNRQIKRTFIHEMTHVWQGQHGSYPREYMIKSSASQSNGVWKDATDKGFTGVMKDVWNNGPLKTWHDYRGRAYAFNMNDIGGYNFNEFNVEQQASIIESWYAPDPEINHLKVPIPGGNMSTSDIRYPFITCNILTGQPNAQYIPVKSTLAPQLPKGADATIKAIQDKLVSLGLLDPKFANGYTGRNTTDAVRAFQKSNGLKVDGDIGGRNSETRKKLGI